MKFWLKACSFALVLWFLLTCLFPSEALGRGASLAGGPPGAWIPRATIPSTTIPTATDSSVSIDEPTSNAYCTPSEVSIGEPFTLSLDIVHDSGLRVLLDAPEGSEDSFGPGWVVVDKRRVVRLPMNDGSGRTLTQVRWRLFGLEPGELQIPVIGADALTSGTVHRIAPRTATVTLRPELAEGEDAARGLLGFQPPPESEDSPLLKIGAYALGLFLLALFTLAALLVRWGLWRRSAPKASSGPSPLAQLAGLDPNDEASSRDLHFNLAHLTRLCLDGTSHRAHAGQTDEEWIHSLRERSQFPAPLLERTERLLSTCAEVKYGARQPTRWAATEAWEEAQAICKEAQAANEAAGDPKSELGAKPRERAEVQA